MSSCLVLFTDSLRYPMARGLGGLQRGSGRFGEPKNLLPLSRFECQKLNGDVCSYDSSHDNIK